MKVSAFYSSNYRLIIQFQGERELNNHLSLIIEFKEVVEANRSSQMIQERDIFDAVNPILFDILQNRPLNGRNKDTRHELRATSLTILYLFYNHIINLPDNTGYRELMRICFFVLARDSEEIAETAQKILGQFFNMNQQSRKVQLIELKEEVISFCTDFLGFLAKVPSLAKNYTQAELDFHIELLPAHLKNNPPPIPEINQKSFQIYGCRSLKLAAKFIHQLLRQCWSDRRERVIESVKESLFNVFKCDTSLSEDVTNSNLSQKLKSVPFFTKGLENMSILFHTVQFLLPNPNEYNSNSNFANNIEYLQNSFGIIIHFFITLSKSLPGHATDMRYQALVGFYAVFNKIFPQNDHVEEEQKVLVGNLRQTAKHVLSECLDQLLDVTVLLGTGQVSYSIVHESANLVYRLFDLLKDRMSEYQLAKAMQMLLHCLLNPLTPLILKSTIIFCLYKFNVELKKRDKSIIVCSEDVSEGQFTNYDLQMEILGQMTLLCKRLSKQTAQGVIFFADSSNSSANPQSKNSTSEPEDNLNDLWYLKERDLEEACNQSFKLSWQHICSTVDPQQNKNQQVGQPSQQGEIPNTMAQKKEHYSRTAKNLFLFVENILIFIKELQKKATLSLKAMQMVQKFFVHGCHLIQNLSEILGATEDQKMKEVCKSFQILLLQLRVGQFRDLLQASGDEVFGLIIECKAKGKEGGMGIFSKYFMQFNSPIQRTADDFISVYLDMFFCYIRRKINVFDPKNEENLEMRFGLTKQDQRLAQISFIKVQEIMQKKLLSIGEQCLHRANDIRVKHTFFGVFMYCIQQIRSGQIVPRYFTIIRNLWKEICNLDEHSVSIKEIMRDFIPMIQGLIETFLQQKDEVTYVKYTKEICCFVPAKLKHLLDYLPAISKPLVESMESNSPEQVESGIHTLQYWLTALATYPELFDPVISHVLPELNACLKPLLTFLPNVSLKLMGKLGAKTRQYDRNNEFKPRNYSEDGLKISLTDKHSKEQIIFGLDAIIDVLLIKILSYGEQFQPADLSAAVAFVRCAFLTYVDKDFDIEFVIGSIVQAKSRDQLPGFKVPPFYQSFDARQRQEPISQMTHGSESHVFEKILRCLIIGCSSLPVHTPEFAAVAKEHTNFMKWVAQYFTLIYICKNKTLTQPTQIDEINPLLFLDYICEFLYYNINQGLTIHKQPKNIRPYYKGSSYAIKTMLRLLNTLYADQTDAFDNLEIVPILIQKICSQVDELPKNLAVNIAIQILIKELPQRALKKNSNVILKTLFQILTQSPDSVVVSVQAELKPTLNSLFEAIGVYTFKSHDITTVEDRDIFNHVVDRIMQNLLSQQQAARQTAKYFLETIALRNKIKVTQLLRSVMKSKNLTNDATMPQSISWHEYLYEFEIERKIKDVFEMFYGGYSQNLQLIAFIEIVQFMLEHGDPDKVRERLPMFFGLAELMLIMLEDESDKFESAIEPSWDSAQLLGPNSSIIKLTKRYMKLERVYLQQNKEYDSYAHTLHTHQFLTTNYFEVSSQAKDTKFKTDVENLSKRQSNIELRIFDRSAQPPSQKIFEKLVEDATNPIEIKEESDKVRQSIRQRIEDFTVKMFGSQYPGQTAPQQSANQQRLRVQDISYDYMHDLYELYPNVRLHCNLSCKMLELICDIVSHSNVQNFVKIRQAEYFENYSATGSVEEESKVVQPPVNLRSRFDFYSVEIKAKIICMQFKFFQRDERNVQKKAKDCLKRLLRQEAAPNEALPNFILKECVRPILNSLTNQSRNTPSNFQHLGKLIKVCYSCFNEALGRHLTKNYENLEHLIKEQYSQINPVEQQTLNRQQIQDEVTFLAEQYNIKVQQIETAVGIINSLHHLCQQKPATLDDISAVMQKAFNFEIYLVEEFEKIFEEQLNKIVRDNDQRVILFAYDKVSPFQIKMGYLRSDMRQGVAKFFNQNYKEVVEILGKSAQLDTFLQILKQRDNFVLRERISRDAWIKQIIHTARSSSQSILDEDKHKFDEKYVLSVNMVYIFSKYHPQYLLQQRNVQILDGLRDRWINKAYTDQFLLNQTKSLYMNIQKSLVIYSRNESSEIQILFDLLKDFQISSVNLDMRPLIKLCTQEIPEIASTSKKIKILEAALNKIQTSNCRFEAKYCMFEFAFMPIALQCANSAQKFHEYFNEKLISLFFATFFTQQSRRSFDPQLQRNDSILVRDEPVWRAIYHELESRQKVSYQSFFTEINKVLLIILKFSTYKTIQKCCPSQDCVLIYRFLDWIAKNAPDLSLKEHAFYTFSCFGVRMLGLQLAGEEVTDNISMTQMAESPQNFHEFLQMLASNVLAPFFEIDLNKTSNKTIIKLTLANLVSIFQDPRVTQIPQNNENSQTRYNIWQYFKRRFSLKPHQQFRLSLCTLVAKQSMLYGISDSDLSTYRRLYKTVEQFVTNNFGISFENMQEFRQPLTLIEALLQWMNKRKGQIQISQENYQQQLLEIQKEVYVLYSKVSKIFEICLISYPSQSQMISFNLNPPLHSILKAKEIFMELSNQCLKMLFDIGTMFPRPVSYSHSEQFSMQQNQDLEKIQLKAIYNLNICGMALTNDFDFPNNLKFLYDFIRSSLQPLQANRSIQLQQPPISFSSVNFKVILYLIHLLKIIITRKDQLLNAEHLSELKQILRLAMQNDVKKSNERDLKMLQGQLVRNFVKQQGNIPPQPQAISAVSPQALHNARIEEMKDLQRYLPHLSIRLIKALEQLRDQGHISEEDFSSWVDNDLYKDIKNAIFRIVSSFRLVVTQEKIPIEGAKSDQPTRLTYEDFPFINNQTEFSLDDPNYDAWIKESIMIAIKSIIVHLKQKMHQDDAYILFENLKLVLKVFLYVRTCSYLLEELYEITRLLVVDHPKDRIKLIEKEKAAWLMRLINCQRLKEISETKESPNHIVNKVYALCLDFLDTQPSLLQNEHSLKIFDRLFWLKPCCSYENRQRMFTIFEKFQGSALKHKINYFMYKVASEDCDQFLQFSQINNLLDFTLSNFKKDVSVYSIRDSSKLIPMHNKSIKIIISPAIKQHPSYTNIKVALSFFSGYMSQQKDLKLENLLMPLSEIIRINPEHSHDKNIAEKIFSKIFWQYWQKILQRQDHLQLAADFNKMTLNIIKYNSTNVLQTKTQFARTMLEQIVALKMPQVRIEPEVLQYMAKHFNLWHLAIPMLEDHVQLFPQNERYVIALQELYNGLMEEDLSMGLCRLTTKSPEMRSLYTFAQHQMWEEINQQFSNYINFYAEQEGLFNFLEVSQRHPGKYSRQLSRSAIIEMVNGVDPLNQTQRVPPSNENFVKIFESQEVVEKLNQFTFPKAGSNRLISELDLRTWENLYIQSLKVLKKNELFRDIAENMSNLDMHELRIDYCWSVKDMTNLKKLLEQVIGPNTMNGAAAQQIAKRFYINPGSIQKVKYHLYQNYILGIQGDRESRNFDENFKDTVKLAIKQWSEYLPSYMDRIQNEYLILFQQIMESNEGGRNMISNQEIQIRKISEYRCAMNIWRERLPNSCESIQTWQDILESRNFIFVKLRDNIIRQQQRLQSEVQLTTGDHEETVDICWNNLKLASVSRKQGLYGLAQYYLNLVKGPLSDPNTRGEKLMLERFRYIYEVNKLNMLTISDSTRQQEFIRDNQSFVENPDYDLWMHAEILRLQGDYMLSKGDINSARLKLLESINKNKKEAKTWISYAKLNEIVQESRNDARSAINALKGYFCALGLNQHKARLIVPFILRLIKSRHHVNSQIIISFVKQNIDQLPTWLWLFWIPQLLQMLKQPKQSLQFESARTIYLKIIRLYPQPAYYPLRTKTHFHQRLQKQNPVFGELLLYCKKILRNKSTKVLEGIESLISEMSQVFKAEDDNFQHILQSTLNFSHFLFETGVEDKLLQFYKRIHQMYLDRPGQQQNSVSTEFHKYFVDPNTMERDLNKQMLLLKNIKDYLLIQKNLKAQTQTLEEVFPQLASLSVKGMELPDQYILSAQEPLPEKVITIVRFDSTVHRSGTNDKKIQFRCSNGKSLAYTFSQLGKILENDYNQYLSDERVNQLKIVMNMLFMRHKESTRRGVKFHVAIKTLLPGSKMTQEDLTFTDFQETHDYLLLEQGIDPDTALLSQLAQVREIFDSYPAEKAQVLSSLDSQQVYQLNLNTFKQLCTQVEPFLLQSYFNRIFYNHDNLFIFKKQFTKYHAVNSLFSYAFNQAEFLRLNSLNFCKATGCLNFTETKLNKCIMNAQVFRGRTFEEIENDFYKIKQKAPIGTQLDNINTKIVYDSVNQSNLPFRLTPNLVHFMGQIGLHGIFAGVMTSASLALTANEQKLSTLIKLIFSEEVPDTIDQATADLQSVQNANFCMYKIKSLSTHKRILEQPPKNEELKAKNLPQTLEGISEDRQTGTYILGESNPIHVPRQMFDLELERPNITEEFNFKVFQLIEMAQEEARLSQRQINWCSWF